MAKRGRKKSHVSKRSMHARSRKGAIHGGADAFSHGMVGHREGKRKSGRGRRKASRGAKRRTSRR
jgi:hypothetical protein